jgi:hypothetical protein
MENFNKISSINPCQDSPLKLVMKDMEPAWLVDIMILVHVLLSSIPIHLEHLDNI